MGEHRLLTAEREERIIQLLQQAKVLSVAQLSDALDVSEATVRRDLQTMSDRRLLKRIRGGATLVSFGAGEPLFQDKESLNTDRKQRIAEAALGLIDDHDRIYLDGGSTVLMLARMLDARSDLTIVTNSLMAAASLMTSPHRLVLVGGEFRALSRTLIGPLTASVIQTIHVDKAFMGTIGFTVEGGMTTTDPQEAFTKDQIMRRADQVVLLADSTKIGLTSFARSGSIEDLNVLVTDALDADARTRLEEHGVHLIVTG